MRGKRKARNRCDSKSSTERQQRKKQNEWRQQLQRSARAGSRYRIEWNGMEERETERQIQRIERKDRKESTETEYWLRSKCQVERERTAGNRTDARKSRYDIKERAPEQGSFVVLNWVNCRPEECAGSGLSCRTGTKKESTTEQRSETIDDWVERRGRERKRSRLEIGFFL